MSRKTVADRAPKQRSSVRNFGWRDKVGYMFGDFGNDFTFLLQSGFFLIFYTNVMGISAAHVGTLLLVARFLDAFTDIGAGWLIDVLRPGRSGRFKPWLLRMMIPVTGAAFLMFSPFLQDGSYGARLAWMIITYVLWGSVFYTLINIPYGSMISVISNKSDERAALSVFRSLGGALAGVSISAVLPLIIFVQINNSSVLSGQRMMLAAAGCGLLAIVCYLLCFANVEERVMTPPMPKEERMGFAKTLATMATNRALTGLIVSSLFMLMAFMFLNGIMPYLFNEYFNNGELLSIVSLVGILPTLLLVPTGPKLAKAFGKKEVGVIGLLMAVVANLVLYAIHTDSPYLFIVGYMIVMFGIMVLNILIWAFITDVIDYQEIRTGERNDSLVYGAYSWARKLGQALAGGLTGWTLGWIGYESTAGESISQTDQVLDSIYSLATGLPALLGLFSALALIFWYPLSKKRVDANIGILEAQRESEGPQA